MQKYWNRFIYRSVGNKFPFWLYLMFVYTFSNGIAFTFFGNTVPVHASVLFQLTSAFGGPLVSLWGIACLIAVFFSVFNLLFRYRRISSIGPWVGYLVWFYASIVFLTHGYIFQAVPAIIQIVFWAHHHMRLINYRHNVDTGVEIPPGDSKF